MALPSIKRSALIASIGAWLAVQIFFFIAPLKNQSVFLLPSQDGVLKIFQSGREAILIGAFSDRYQNFPRMELVPYLKKKGVQKIRKLILTGHDLNQTGALGELQKNFKVIEVFYPPDAALRMRKTFEQIGREVELSRISRESTLINGS